MQQLLITQLLITLGIILLIIGLAWPLLSRLPFGRLPGDIYIQKENFTFYFPLTTGLLISIILSVLLWLWMRK